VNELSSSGAYFNTWANEIDEEEIMNDALQEDTFWINELRTFEKECVGFDLKLFKSFGIVKFWKKKKNF